MIYHHCSCAHHWSSGDNLASPIGRLIVLLEPLIHTVLAGAQAGQQQHSPRDPNVDAKVVPRMHLVPRSKTRAPELPLNKRLRQ